MIWIIPLYIYVQFEINVILQTYVLYKIVNIRFNFVLPRFLCVLFQIYTITEVTPMHINTLWIVPRLNFNVCNMQVVCHLWYTNTFLGSRERSCYLYLLHAIHWILGKVPRAQSHSPAQRLRGMEDSCYILHLYLICFCPEYSGATARWRLSNNQSINQWT